MLHGVFTPPAASLLGGSKRPVQPRQELSVHTSHQAQDRRCLHISAGQTALSGSHDNCFHQRQWATWAAARPRAFQSSWAPCSLCVSNLGRPHAPALPCILPGGDHRIARCPASCGSLRSSVCGLSRSTGASLEMLCSSQLPLLTSPGSPCVLRSPHSVTAKPQAVSSPALHLVFLAHLP